MRKILLILTLIAGSAVLASAQPRSAGFRLGSTGFEAAYQHSINKSQFIEGDFGVDFGAAAGKKAGARLTALYNIIWARPAWTDEGSWAIYAGPGLSLGYVADKVVYDVADARISFFDKGVMLAIAAQVGLEYTFEFPLQISVDIRPYLGMHSNTGIKMNDQQYAGKSGFYNAGLAGFIPSISVKYRF